MLVASALVWAAGCFGSSTPDKPPVESLDASSQTDAFVLPDASGPEASTPEAGSDAADVASGGFTVGGHVTGLAGKGLVLRNDGADDLAVTVDGAFTFKTPVGAGAPYAVTVAAQPTAPTQDCTVANGTGAASADVTDVQVTCATNAYSVGGTVVGLDPASTGGLVLVDTLAGGVTDTMTVNQSGSFTFPTKVPSGGAFAVTVQANPTSPAQSCSVSGGTGTIVTGPVTSVVVNCAANAHVVGGTVSGLSGAGLVLQNGSATVAISANGSFALPSPVPSGASYSVTVATQPTGPSQTCTVSGGTGVMGSTDVTSVSVACTTNSFTVGGTVSGLGGSGLVLQDNGGDPLPVASDGSFTFAKPVASGAQYAVTVQTQPTQPWQSCSVTAGTGIVGAGAVSNVQVACKTNSYPVQVTATGVQGSGLTVTLGGGDTLAIPADGTFIFATQVPSGATYTVAVSAQPTGPTQSCTVSNGSGTVAGGAVADVAVSCSTNDYAVGGSVSGLVGTGLVLTDDGGDSLAIAPGASSFTFAKHVASGSAYDVEIAMQPSNPSQTCTVSGNTGTVGSADVAGVVLNCGTNTFTVGGTVTGLSGSGLVLQNGGATLSVTAKGSFAFPPVASGTTYDVTVATQPSSPTQSCTVTGGQGLVGGANVTSVQVACTTVPFPVGGTLSGLAPNTSVVLQDNGGDDLTVSANGAFNFTTPVASGSSYAVTVKTQPTGPWQTCTTTGTTGSGLVLGGAVTSVLVACKTNPYQVSAAVSGLHGTGLGVGLGLALNGGSSTSVTVDGTYSLGQLASGSNYAVAVTSQPTVPWQTCTVSAPGTQIADTDVTVNVACATNPYWVGGTVSGLAGTGLQLKNSDDGDVVNVPAGATSFKFPTQVPSNQTFNAVITGQPSNPTQSCSISGAQGTVAGQDVGSIVVNCSTKKATIAGTVTVDGVTAAPGAGLVLTNTPGTGTPETLPVSTSSFAFAVPVASGVHYAVAVASSPTSPVQSCIVSNGSGVVGSTDVINDVVVACTTTRFHVLAAVSGLQSGTTLLLEDNGADDLTFTSSGTQTFGSTVASGKGYSVTVKTMPANQTCSVDSPSGTVTNADVTLNVTCSPILQTLQVNLDYLQSGGGGLVLDVNGASVTNAYSGWTTPVQQGASYSVSIATQPTGQTCVAASSLSGTMPNGPATVEFRCDWDLSVTVHNGWSVYFNGFEHTYSSCDSLSPPLSIPVEIIENGVSSGYWSVASSGLNSIPVSPMQQGSALTVSFGGSKIQSGQACFCGTNYTDQNFSYQPYTLTSIPSVVSAENVDVYCTPAKVVQ
jgi:hypothetical protein